MGHLVKKGIFRKLGKKIEGWRHVPPGMTSYTPF